MSAKNINGQFSARNASPSEKAIREAAEERGYQVYAYIRARGGVAIGAICISRFGHKVRFMPENEGDK